MKSFIILTVLALSLAIALPAQASFCRHVKVKDSERVICIENIKRSAKNYWEYRAQVSIDGVKRKVEIYNCRNRIRIQSDGTVVRFQPNGAGELICSILNKR
ncbi:MAG: hypothetical protein N3E45_16075 [Oscillatoriaceae bacterium SKW80]|nr:hypothetical protein [Oscillatoriaceae bacterium SKYG93]MCX8122315.1 hypothetical protein [Oscillatoriaceae bacterium SKW80]HIK29624.1 hypothetical protein [Oscillatoriaceae cyanobacterium M7585_C2015_266]